MGQALSTGSLRQRPRIQAGTSERFLEPGGRACAVPRTAVAESVAKVRLRKRSDAGEEEARAAAGLLGCRAPGAMGRLHCMQDPVPEAVRSDMQQLNQLGAQVGLAWAREVLRSGPARSGDEGPWAPDL